MYHTANIVDKSQDTDLCSNLPMGGAIFCYKYTIHGCIACILIALFSTAIYLKCVISNALMLTNKIVTCVHVHWTANKMIVVGRELVNKHAERMAILLSCGSVVMLTVLTKRSCAYTMYVHSGEV